MPTQQEIQAKLREIRAQKAAANSATNTPSVSPSPMGGTGLNPVQQKLQEIRAQKSSTPSDYSPSVPQKRTAMEQLQKKGLLQRASDVSSTFLTGLKDVGMGVGKGVIETGASGIDLLSKATGIKPVMTTDTQGIRKIAAPKNTMESVGKFGERVGEFVLAPGGGAGKAAETFTKGLVKSMLPKIAQKTSGKLLSSVAGATMRATTEGVQQAALSAAQKGTTEDIGSDFAIGAAFPALGGVTKGIARGAGEVLGLTTGTGYGAIKQAFRDNSPEFRRALRGNVDDTMTEVLGGAKDALEVVRNNRQTAYRSMLEKIKDVNVDTNLEELKVKALEQLKNYGVKVTDEGLDFSRSRIADKTEANRLQEMVDTIFEWGSQEGDRSVAGLDTLKQRLDDFYSPSSQVRSYVTTMRNEVANRIKKAVPQYTEMTKGYQEASRLIEDIQNGLSLKLGEGKMRPDTAIRKLTSILRENNEHRRELLRVLEEAAGNNLAGQVAGAQMSSWAPRGLAKIVGTLGAGATAWLNPTFIPALAVASPRVVGELVASVGKIYRSTKNVLPQAIKGVASQLNK